MTLDLIKEQAEKINCPYNVSDELKQAYSISRAIDEFLLEEYFPKQKPIGKRAKTIQINKILDLFEADIISSLSKINEDFDKIRKSKAINDNLFIYAGTKKLYLSNKYTRTISTKLGNYIEKIISIDKSKSFDSEEFFKAKIKGVDKFILDSNNVLKTCSNKNKKRHING